MTSRHSRPRSRTAGGAARRRTAAVAIIAGLLLGAPGIALAVFTSTPTSPTASVTAATITAPATFTATATGPKTADLSWSAVGTATGYTLSQSPGTLAGCSATPTTTSCTATGLTSGTIYTWTLHAVYNNWTSPPSQASATALPFAADIGNATAPCLLQALTIPCTGPTVPTASSHGELIFVYSTGVSILTSPSVTGPFSGTPTLYESQSLGLTNLYVFRATGDGTTKAVKATFGLLALLPAVWIDVVELAGGESALAACNSCGGSGASSPAVASLTVQPGTDSEIAFIGMSGGTITPAPGFTAFGGGGLGAPYGTYGKASIEPSSSFPLTPSSADWASISLQITP